MRRIAHLKVTYKKGKPFAAYLYLPADSSQKAASTREVRPGFVADFDGEGRVLGLEIVNPAESTREQVLDVLRELHVAEIAADELAPIG
jgi:uncharacterized protein YuzE